MGRFAAAYRRHFGGTDSAVPLYGGFTAFFVGIAVAGLGILIVVSGATIIETPAARNGLGITMAAIGLPLFFLGLQLTLPSRLAIHLIAGTGAVICFAGVFLFNQAWPGEFGPRGEPDRSGSIIFLYTIGLAALSATTAMALVVNFISRHVVLPGRELDDIFADPERSVSMEEVMRDIEREVARQKLTWGGMEEDRLPREYVKLRADFGPGAHISEGRVGKITETIADEMDTAFTALARLRGSDRHTTGDDDTATAIEALRALRRARQLELESSWWYRFKRWLVQLFTGKGTQPQDPKTDAGMNAPGDGVSEADAHSDHEPEDQSDAPDVTDSGAEMVFEEIKTK